MSANGSRDGQMDADELREALGELGLTQVEAAERLNVSDRAVRYWVAGENEIPGPAEALIECWLNKAREGTHE